MPSSSVNICETQHTIKVHLFPELRDRPALVCHDTAGKGKFGNGDMVAPENTRTWKTMKGSIGQPLE